MCSAAIQICRRSDSSLGSVFRVVAVYGLIRLRPPRNPKPVTYRPYPRIEQAIREPMNFPTIELVTPSVGLVLTKVDSIL